MNANAIEAPTLCELNDFKNLLSMARQGCLETQGRLLQNFRGYLLDLAEANLDSDIRPKVAASDIVQESLLEAHRDFGRFRGRTPPELRGWMKRILLNNLLNHFRAWRETHKRRLSREVEFAGAWPGAPGPADPHGRTASDIVSRREEQERLDEALDQLSEDDQQVLRLRHGEGLAFEEIGRRMNRTGDAARMLWYRAFDRLSRKLPAD